MTSNAFGLSVLSDQGHARHPGMVKGHIAPAHGARSYTTRDMT